MRQGFTQMKWIELLRHGKTIYNFAELLRLTGLSVSSLRRALHRLTQREVLFKLGKGLYGNSFNSPRLEEVSALLYPPTYVSMESALFIHGILDQTPYMVTCVSTNKTKAFFTPLGEIDYCHIKKELFFGYDFSDQIPLAWPEKSALDFVYIQRMRCLEPSLDEWNWEHLNRNKLISLLEFYPKVMQNYFGKFMFSSFQDS